jgi:O-antigen/teichoic acid export membrane protein
VSAAPALQAAPSRARESGVRFEGVDRRDAALLSAGTIGSGVLAYAFNVIAARALGPEAFAAVGALWAGMFLLAVLLFRPLEQTVARAVADRVARGADAREAVRVTAWLGGGVAVVAVVACLAAWQPITDSLFGGRPALTVALVAGLAGYALSYFARGLTGGVRWFGGYGLVLLADGGVRLVVALPLLIWASTTLAGVAIAAAAVGGALAPLFSRDRRALRKINGAEPGGHFALGAAAAFAAPAAVIAGCEQILLSGGPLIVLVRGGQGAAATAGVLFAAALLVRAPVFLFQGVAASLLANFTTYRAQGDYARVHKATATVALACAGLAAAGGAAALVAGPFAMELLYGAGFDATRGDLALLAVGIGGFLAASTFSQALLAADEARAAAIRWALATTAFVVMELTLPGSAFTRVCVGFATAGALVGVLLMARVWRDRP